MNTSSYICTDCGINLPKVYRDSSIKCPICGSTNRSVTVVLDAAEYKMSGKINWEIRSVFYKKNLIALVLIVFLSVIPILISLLMDNLTSIFISILLGVMVFIYSPDAIIKYREIRSGQT